MLEYNCRVVRYLLRAVKRSNCLLGEWFFHCIAEQYSIQKQE